MPNIWRSQKSHRKAAPNHKSFSSVLPPRPLGCPTVSSNMSGSLVQLLQSISPQNRLHQIKQKKAKNTDTQRRSRRFPPNGSQPKLLHGRCQTCPHWMGDSWGSPGRWATGRLRRAERVRGARHRAQEAWIQRKPPHWWIQNCWGYWITGGSFRNRRDWISTVQRSPKELLGHADLWLYATNLDDFYPPKQAINPQLHGYVAWTSSQVKCVKRQILSSCGRKIKSTLGTSRNNIHQSQHVQSPNTLH